VPTGMSLELVFKVGHSELILTRAEARSLYNQLYNLFTRDHRADSFQEKLEEKRLTYLDVENPVLDPNYEEKMTLIAPSVLSSVTGIHGLTSNATIYVYFDSEMADPTGKHAQFGLLVGTASGSITSVALGSVNKSLFELEIDTVITAGASVELSYTKGTVEDIWGVELESFSGLAVTNIVVPIPEFVFAKTDTAGDTMYITFSEEMADPTGKHAQFKYQIDGGADLDMTAIERSTSDLTLYVGSLNTTISSGATVTLSYTAGTIVSNTGGILASFTGKSVENLATLILPIALGTGPLGTTIALEFNESMADPTGKHAQFSFKVDGGAARNFTSFELSVPSDKIIVGIIEGPAITAGATVTISYTKGTVVSEVGRFVDSFSDLAVINNVT